MPLTKEKRKLSKLIEQSDSEESDHELSYYVNDRIKLMKEVLKVIKPKKIKLMAPSCLKVSELFNRISSFYNVMSFCSTDFRY